MKKIFLSLLFIICYNTIFSQKRDLPPKKIYDTSNFTLKDTHPNNYLKIVPGCIEPDKFDAIKTFLNKKCKIDLDAVGTVNIYYLMPKTSCDHNLYKSVSINQRSNYYFKLHHPNEYTKITYPVIFVQYEPEVIDMKWTQDDNNLLYNLFLDYDKSLHCDAMITISKDRLYLLDWDYFNPEVFNAFSNELKKFNCD